MCPRAPCLLLPLAAVASPQEAHGISRNFAGTPPERLARSEAARGRGAGGVAIERGHIEAVCEMPSCMRTTLDINDEILRMAKRRARQGKTSLRAVVEAALRHFLGRPRRRRSYSLRRPSDRGRLRSCVRLDDRDALFDLMDSSG